VKRSFSSSVPEWALVGPFLRCLLPRPAALLVVPLQLAPCRQPSLGDYALKHLVTALETKEAMQFSRRHYSGLMGIAAACELGAHLLPPSLRFYPLLHTRIASVSGVPCPLPLRALVAQLLTCSHLWRRAFLCACMPCCAVKDADQSRSGQISFEDFQRLFARDKNQVCAPGRRIAQRVGLLLSPVCPCLCMPMCSPVQKLPQVLFKLLDR
jgi:hypothetical protein